MIAVWCAFWTIAVNSGFYRYDPHDFSMATMMRCARIILMPPDALRRVQPILASRRFLETGC